MQNIGPYGPGYGLPYIRFEGVLSSLENSLHVQLIASFDLKVCQPDDLACQVLANPDASEYSQLPVSEEGAIVGVLERGLDTTAIQIPVREIMKPLRDDMIIESSTGILSYIRLAAERPYHLVLTGKAIRGIVTPSDLLKLPVRIVLFTFLTHLEATMSTVIRNWFDDDSWRDCLSAGRRAKLDEEINRGRTANVYSGQISYTQWGDKKTIIAKRLGKKHLGSVTQFKKQLGALGNLRDNVMHANDYLSEPGTLSEQIQIASCWIERLGTLVEAHKS